MHRRWDLLLLTQGSAEFAHMCAVLTTDRWIWSAAPDLSAVASQTATAALVLPLPEQRDCRCVPPADATTQQ
ncbi:hypothetical protein SCP_0100070 [Sparassis crispa]|uniref:Uncharacterized protein n=1 Tax=Sparassis crispa TaxID=139825 RepID=A0A401G4M9_9APHY|nr:hypothetical protein SCP_0100070 [Sparassis crispa]GBE77135.1 hypothetical protein SCP_0100070 [Sparassis crispa]